jgi:hypothetical protein
MKLEVQVTVRVCVCVCGGGGDVGVLSNVSKEDLSLVYHLMEK